MGKRSLSFCSAHQIPDKDCDICNMSKVDVDEKESMDSYECPKCKSENTYCINDFLEYAIEYRKCEDCDCNYEVEYEMTVKEIRIRK